MIKLRLPLIKSTLMIFLSFLLTSTGHLSWMYHLMGQTSAELSNQLTAVAGYALQAAGLGIFMLLLRQRWITKRVIFIASLIAYSVCLVPAVMGTSLTGTVVFGLLLSLFCGVIAGYYLYELTECAPAAHRALSFGVGYGAATLVSWLLSLIADGAVYYGSGVVIICLAAAALTAAVAFIKAPPQDEEAPQATAAQVKLPVLLLIAGGVVLLFSLVNNIGFSFSASEVKNGIHLEFSRIFYGVGLIAAGFVTDKSRRHGAVCALAALVIPFIVLALRGEPISSTIFWALGYFAFGFYAVYRVILFSDIAKSRGLAYLSGVGLLIGRIGDALGTEINTVLIKKETVSVILAAALFVGAVFLFIRLFQLLYFPAPLRQKSERELFDEFAVQYDLSGREREVLRLLLEDKSNKEISEVICISENTVKFHVHNLLQKTGCKSRVELKAAYRGSRM